MAPVGQFEQAPPAYDELPGESPPSQNQPSTRYTPVQYGLSGQDPLVFYGDLINPSNHPSQILCRMSDALFFHLNQHCNQFRNTMLIEPAKIAWLNIALGKNAQITMLAVKHLSALYDAALVPYTVNDAQLPVLDRRGYLHLCVSDMLADPVGSHKRWNKKLNILKLHDPMTKAPFPTPIPRSAFPPFPDLPSKEAYDEWQDKTTYRVSRQMAAAQQQIAPPSNNSNVVPTQDNPAAATETQSDPTSRTLLEEQRARQAMRMTLDNMSS